MIVLVTVIVCLIAGILSGLLGIGGGLVLVPLFHYVLKLNLHTAVGTSLAIIVPTALVAALRHAAAHSVDWRTLLFGVVFTVIGAYVGASLSVGLDATLLRRIFAAFLVLVAIRMFFQ